MTPQAPALEPATAAGPDAPKPRDRRGGLPFSLVFGVFVALLAIGIAGGVSIHRSYVGFERVAARHVPPDATLVLRWDVEKVSLFEPTRRFILPLVDEAPPHKEGRGLSRRERFAQESGIVLGRDLREVLVAFGPGEGDWSVLLGGSFPPSDLAAAAERTFAADGARWRQLAARRIVTDTGVALAQGDDGVLVLASSVARLDAALASHPLAPDVPRLGAGALVVGAGTAGLPKGGAELLAALGSPQAVRGELRWGNPLPLNLELEFASAPPADVKDRIGRALDLLLGEDLPRLEHQYGPVRVQPAGNRAVRVELLVDDTGLERAAKRAAGAVESALGVGPAQK